MKEEQKTMKQMFCPKCYQTLWSFIGYWEFEDRLELVFICNNCGLCTQTDYIHNSNKLNILKKKRGNYFD